MGERGASTSSSERLRSWWRFSGSCVLWGVVLTLFFAWPGAWLARRAGLSNLRSVFGRHPLMPFDSHWRVMHFFGWFRDAWTLYYPGEFLIDSETPLEVIDARSLPSWFLLNLEPPDPHHDFDSVTSVATGFPFRAMRSIEWSGYFYPPDRPMSKSTARYAVGYREAWQVFPDRAGSAWPSIVLPLRPIWPGALLDVLVWALVVAAARLGHRAELRRFRRRRGLCTTCAYDLRGRAGPRCPECGDLAGPMHDSASPSARKRCDL